MRLRVVLLLAVVAAGLVPGCGQDDPLELVATAGAETVDEGVARVTATTEVTAAATVTVTAHGLIDLRGSRSALTMDLPLGGGQMAMVVDGTDLYLSGGGVAAELGAPTPWASVDLRRVGDLTGTDLAQLQSSSEAASGLGLLAGAEDVEEVGTEAVGGVSTTHYSASVDPRKAIEGAGAVTDRERFEAFAANLGAARLDVDVWLDGEDRVRRLRYAQPIGALLAVRQTIEFSDFGTQERIEVPPPGEVTDITDRFLRDG